jgi:general secretion pathway protein F
MEFDIRALAPDNVMHRLTVTGTDADDARRQVEARGLVVAEVRTPRAAGLRLRGGGKLALVLFTQELLALLEAGLGVVEALETLREKESAPVAAGVLDGLLEALRSGQRLSGALAGQGVHFPPLYVGIVRAAEGTSDLPRALARYLDYRRRIDTVRARVVSAAIYPAILMVVGTGVSLFLIVYVVPRFAEVYQGAGRSLPWLSRVLLAWGQFAAAHTVPMTAGLVALVGALALGLRRLLADGSAARLLARMPGVGERIRIYELARLYLTLGMLTEGGITVVQAIGTVHGMMSAALAPRLARARSMIESGLPLSAAFEECGLTTPVSLRMLRVGERSGNLGPMLSQSAAFYDGEIGRWIERFTRAFEPLLMAAIGIVVGTIVVLLYMPIFDLAGDMS